MKQRILTAIAGVPILLLFMYLGGTPFACLVAVLATVGLHEFYTMAKGKHQVLFVPVLLGVWAMLLCSYLGVSNWLTLGILITFCLVFGYAVFKFPAFGVEDIAVNFLGLIYIGWTLSHLILLGAMDNGRVLVFMAFGCLFYWYLVRQTAAMGNHQPEKKCGRHHRRYCDYMHCAVSDESVF